MTNELLVSRVGGLRWAAVRDRERTVELWAEPLGEGSPVGRILSGRVAQVVPSMRAAFVDVGEERSLFLPYDRMPAGAREPKVGHELVVQISGEGGPGKSPRATARPALAGRCLVLCVGAARHTVSRRITDAAERSRLTGVVDRLGGDDLAWIARTAAGGASEARLQGEAGRLRAMLARVRALAVERGVPARLLEPPALPERLLRDAPIGGYERIRVDHDDDLSDVTRALETFADRGSIVTRHPGPVSLFHEAGLRDALERATRPRVWLPSGGRLTIQETEALVAIDVDTGRAVRGSDQRAAVRSTNLEAAREIGRQLRLRGLGGIVVVDFIDMTHDDDRRAVTAELQQALHDDPARVRLSPPDEFGLIRLTRRRIRAGLLEVLGRTCPTCDGLGRIRGDTAVASEALAEWLRRDGAVRGLSIRLPAGAAGRAGLDDTWPASALECVREDPSLAAGRWAVGDGPPGS